MTRKAFLILLNISSESALLTELKNEPVTNADFPEFFTFWKKVMRFLFDRVEIWLLFVSKVMSIFSLHQLTWFTKGQSNVYTFLSPEIKSAKHR